MRGAQEGVRPRERSPHSDPNLAGLEAQAAQYAASIRSRYRRIGTHPPEHASPPGKLLGMTPAVRILHDSQPLADGTRPSPQIGLELAQGKILRIARARPSQQS